MLGQEVASSDNEDKEDDKDDNDKEKKKKKKDEDKKAAKDNGGKCRVSNNYSSGVLQWCGLITKYAEQRGLDPNLIAAVMTQESGGNPLAYSHSGAVGLMQVMPRDGIAASFQCPNGPCFAGRPSIAQLQDPQYNLEYATGMLAGLVSRYGSVREALFHYGPTGSGYYYADKVLGILAAYK